MCVPGARGPSGAGLSQERGRTSSYPSLIQRDERRFPYQQDGRADHGEKAVPGSLEPLRGRRSEGTRPQRQGSPVSPASRREGEERAAGDGRVQL